MNQVCCNKKGMKENNKSSVIIITIELKGIYFSLAHSVCVGVYIYIYIYILRK